MAAMGSAQPARCLHTILSVLRVMRVVRNTQLQPFVIRRTASVAGGKGVEALLNTRRHIGNSSSASLRQNIPFDEKTIPLVV
jgi:hypothetical protein